MARNSEPHAKAMFTITSLESDAVFKSYFGDGAALVVDGYGGWTVEGRPKNIGLTVWEGRNPIAVEIPFVIDHYSFGMLHSIPAVRDGRDPDEFDRCNATEDMCHVLGNLCGLGDDQQPPLLGVDGGGAIPHDDTMTGGDQPGQVHQWVIESVVWDRAIEVRSDMYQLRMRCGGMLTIRQHKSSNDILRRLGPKNRARKPQIYIVKKGDTLQKIASAKYGNPNKWKIIADANNLRDPRSLTVGKQLRIPR
jgi:hypothetical protein